MIEKIVDWIVVRKFPLEKKLDAVVHFLRQRGVVFRVYEESSLQVLAIQDPKLLSPINQFLDDIESGKIVLDSTDTQALVDEQSLGPSLFAQAKMVPVTMVLIVLSFIGALLVFFDKQIPLKHWFLFQETLPWYISRSSTLLPFDQVWRFITPAFLHFGPLHVLFNSLWMWELGRRLELLMGRIPFLLFFLFSASFSNIAQYLWSPYGEFGGMSGVVYALVGYIIVCQKIMPNPLTNVPKATLVFMLVWLVVCMTGAVEFIFGSGIANAAHLGGLFAGIIFAALTLSFNLSNIRNRFR